MEGFGQSKSWLARFFPPGEDFEALLAELAEKVHASVSEARTQLLAAEPELARTDAAFTAVRLSGHAVIEALNRSFATNIDREDIFRAVEELVWVAEFTDHAARERVAMQVTPDHAMQQLSERLLQETATLHEAFQALRTDKALCRKLARQVQSADSAIRRIYERALADLLVPDADPIDAIKRREIYHHLTDGGKRLRKSATVLAGIVVKEPD